MIEETDSAYCRKLEFMRNNNAEFKEKIISLEGALKVQRNHGTHMENMAEFFK